LACFPTLRDTERREEWGTRIVPGRGEGKVRGLLSHPLRGEAAQWMGHGEFVLIYPEPQG